MAEVDISGLIAAIRDLIQALQERESLQGREKAQAGDSQQMLNATLGGVQAINGLAGAIEAAFPQGNSVSSSAGGASGSYLAVVLNGNTYKIQLLNP